MVDLMPCPFGCGPAEVREWDWPYTRFQVRCPKCKCSQGVRKASKAEAIAVWNTRASPPATQVQITEAQSASLHKAMLASLDMEPATQADDAELVKELAPAIDEACVAYQQAFKDEFNPSRWDVPSADMARAILPIIHRHRIEARRKALEDAAEKVRDVMVAQEWPPQDGDRQIDEVLDAIRAMIEGEG